MEAVCLPQSVAGQALEDALGDPMDPSVRFSFRHVMEQDEAEEYPAAVNDLLNGLGVLEYYLPASVGGKLASIEELSLIIRVISRRDLTVAIAHGGRMLGLSPIWASKSEALKRRAAALIRTDKKLGLGLTERHHGSDLLANELRGRGEGSGYRLDGEKWLIGHGRMASAFSVLCRTADPAGPRAFTMLYIDLEELREDSVYRLPRIRTMGVRGLDMSGIGFRNANVSRENMLSEEGKGLDLVLTGLQVTRNLSSALSLGSLDTVLRLVIGFVRQRRLYGQTIDHSPVVRATLLDAFTDLVAADCLSTAMNRAFHVLPRECSLYSAVIKGSVPELLEAHVPEVAKVLGARFFLRDEHAFGIVQKMLRDSIVIGVGDGNTAVNLHAAIVQMKAVFVRERKRATSDPEELLPVVFDVSRPLPTLDFGQLQISNVGRCLLMAAFDQATQHLANYPSRYSELLRQQFDLVLAELRRIEGQLLEDDVSIADVFQIPAHYYDLARQFCRILMASTCVSIWHHNRGNPGMFADGPEWLVLCLDRILTLMRAPRERSPLLAEAREVVYAHMVELYETERLFAVFPIQLARVRTEVVRHD